MSGKEARETSTFNLTRLSATDIEQIMEVEQSAWDPEWQASPEKFLSRLKIFPEGVMGIYDGKHLVGMTTSMVTDFRPENLNRYAPKWSEITADGFITNHNPEGNSLYVVSVAVHQDFQRRGLGQRLLAAQVALASTRNLEYVVLGARLPGLKGWLENKYSEKIPFGCELEREAQKYLFLTREDGKFLDPEIRFYCNYGGLQVGKLIPNFGSDIVSCNFGVIVFGPVEEKKR